MFIQVIFIHTAPAVADYIHLVSFCKDNVNIIIFFLLLSIIIQTLL